MTEPTAPTTLAEVEALNEQIATAQRQKSVYEFAVLTDVIPELETLVQGVEEAIAAITERLPSSNERAALNSLVDVAEATMTAIRNRAYSLNMQLHPPTYTMAPVADPA
jgi:hypothetical protein